MYMPKVVMAYYLGLANAYPASEGAPSQMPASQLPADRQLAPGQLQVRHQIASSRQPATSRAPGSSQPAASRPPAGRQPAPIQPPATLKPPASHQPPPSQPLATPPQGATVSVSVSPAIRKGFQVLPGWAESQSVSVSRIAIRTPRNP